MNKGVPLTKKDKSNRLYRIYADAGYRCTCKTNRSYGYYGARGIRMKWNSFDEFYRDMIDSYLKHVEEYGEKNTELDRINNNGNYCQENCRWATRKEQNNNSRHTNKIEFNGVTRSLSEWAEFLGIKRTTLSGRIKTYGFSLEKALVPGKYSTHGKKYA